MEKRVILAIGLCVAVMIAWTKFFPVRPPTPVPVAQTAPAANTEAARPTLAGGPSAAVRRSPPVRPSPIVPSRRSSSRRPTPASSSRAEGRPCCTRSCATRSSATDRRTPPAVTIWWRRSDPQEAPLRTTFPKSGFPEPADGSWETRQPAPNTVVFATDTGNVHIEKRFVADTTRYRLHLDVTVTNRGAQPVDQHLAISLSGRQDPEKKGGGFMSGSSANTASMLCAVDDKVERKPIEKLGKDPLDKLGAVKWVATDEKFFLLAVVPYPESPPHERGCAATAQPDGTGQVTLSFAERTVPPQGTVDYPFAIYAGPKVITDLEAVRPGGQEVELDKAVDVTLSFLSRPILSLLKFFYSFAHNWGLAIILLTLFIKLLTFYPTQKSLLSAKKMQKLAPKMNAIRKKYENDRQRQSVETMNLYKAHGVSPFGGCLPSLIQMPIWIALYSTLNYAVELYRAPFFAHIHDLTAKDPFYITPLLMGGVMFAQMRMSPSGADQQQQQMMSMMMPIMFTGFSLFLPAGLALYMLTSYLIGILQQLYVNHLDRKGAAAV